MLQPDDFLKARILAVYIGSPIRVTNQIANEMGLLNGVHIVNEPIVLYSTGKGGNKSCHVRDVELQLNKWTDASPKLIQECLEYGALMELRQTEKEPTKKAVMKRAKNMTKDIYASFMQNVHASQILAFHGYCAPGHENFEFITYKQIEQ